MIHGRYATMFHGFYGVVGSTLATLTPMQENIEFATREVGALLGVVVALISIYNLVRQKLKHDHAHSDSRRSDSAGK